MKLLMEIVKGGANLDATIVASDKFLNLDEEPEVVKRILRGDNLSFLGLLTDPDISGTAYWGG